VHNTRWISVYIRPWYKHDHKGRWPAQPPPDIHQPSAGLPTWHHCSDGGPDLGVQRQEQQPCAAPAIHQHNVHTGGEGWWDLQPLQSDILSWPEENLYCINLHWHYQSLYDVLTTWACTIINRKHTVTIWKSL